MAATRRLQDRTEYARTLLGQQHQNECDANEYAEIKALVGGATSTVGSLGSGDIRCIEGVVRNLDFASDIPGRKVNNEVFRFAISLDRRDPAGFG